MPPEGVLIIGYGNPLRGDDAAGPLAARRLAGFGFETIETHQLTPELAEPIAAAEIVFFLDADAAVPAGEICAQRVTASEAEPPLSFEHHSTPAGLLRLAALAYRAAPEAWAIGLGARCFDLAEGLSRNAERAVSRAVQELPLLAHALVRAAPALMPAFRGPQQI